ncbi:hypothetical protein EBS02_02330 [bacterium]|nr:hypothetical protein [bacterium]
MPNVIKFSESGSANSIRKGRASIGINAVSYAPTSQTGFWNGVNVPIGGYIVYQERTGEDYTNYGFSAAVILNDSGLIGYARSSGAENIETAGDALAWIATQPGLLCVKGDSRYRHRWSGTQP